MRYKNLKYYIALGILISIALFLMPDVRANSIINLSANQFDDADIYVAPAGTGSGYGFQSTMLIGQLTNSPVASIGLILVNPTKSFYINPSSLVQANILLKVSSQVGSTKGVYNVSACDTKSFIEGNYATPGVLNDSNYAANIQNCTTIITDFSASASTKKYNITSTLLSWIDRNFVIQFGDNRTAPTKNYTIVYSRESTTNPPLLEIETTGKILNVTIIDENTNLPITAVNITLQISGSDYSQQFITDAGAVTILGLGQDYYSATGSNFGAGYYTRTFYSGNISINHNLVVYLINGTGANVKEVTFTIADLNSERPIEGVSFNGYRMIGFNNTLFWSGITDVVGRAVIWLDSSVTYNFNLTMAGYNPKNFYLIPTSNDYLIYLQKNASTLFNNTQGDVIYTITPQSTTMPTNATQDFVLTTSSASGYITNFGAWGNGQHVNVSNANGGTATLTLNTTPFENQTLQVQYFIQTQQGSMKINQSYRFYNLAYNTNQSVSGLFGDYVSQINPFYRFLFAIIVSLILGAGFFVFIGTTGATIVSVMAFFGFAVVGFIDWWIAIPLGILVVLGYVVIGGNEGT